MRLLKILSVIISFLAILIIGAYAYYGGFHKVDVKFAEAGGEIVVYEDMIGDYKNSAKVMDELYYKLVNEENISPTRGIGIYYDNPKNKAKEELRSEIGEILDDIDEVKIEELKKKYNIRKLPNGLYVEAEFPFNGFPSIFIGINKVYPLIAKFLEERGIYTPDPSIEIYDVKNKKIIYRILVSE